MNKHLLEFRGPHFLELFLLPNYLLVFMATVSNFFFYKIHILYICMINCVAVTIAANSGLTLPLVIVAICY